MINTGTQQAVVRQKRFKVEHSQTAVWFALALAVASLAGIANAADAQPVWLLSTRCASHCGTLDDPNQAIRYWHLSEDSQWAPSDATSFHATDDTKVPTVVFLHGNRTDDDEAVTKGWCAYEGIRSVADGRPFRFVIWSWPADRVLRKHRADTQLKAEYSDVDSYYLAHWLNGVRPGVKLSLVGHSFGPRIIAGALHLLAGGEVACRQLPPEVSAGWTAGKRNSLRIMLMAAAMDADSLAPCSSNGQALSLVDQAIITRNACDRVLKWYPRLYGRGGPGALGYVGPCGATTGNVELLDMTDSVGRTHDWQCYCSALTACGLWARYTFLDDTSAQPAAPARDSQPSVPR